MQNYEDIESSKTKLQIA